MRTLAQEDLYYLLVRVCGRVDMLHSWILARTRDVQRNPNGRLFLWSREHYKSSIITFGLTLQDILNDPSKTFIICSEKFEISSAFLKQLKREFEQNKLLKELFPEIVHDDPFRAAKKGVKWSEREICVKRKTNQKEATITAMGLDALRVGMHVDVLIYDDVITDRSTTSIEMIDKITHLFQQSTSLSKQGGVKRFIGTRYHLSDTYQYIMDKGMAVPDIKPATDDGTASGKPVLFTQEYWDQKIIDNSTYTMACQFLQNPLQGSKSTFNVNDVSWWDVRPRSMQIYILGDPGRTKNSNSCDTAFVVLGLTANHHMYLLDGYCHKMTLTERWYFLRLLYERWKPYSNKPIYVAYETFGSGYADMEYFKEQMTKGFEGQHGSRFDIKSLEDTSKGRLSKNERIDRMEPDMKQHKIHLPWDNADQEGHAGVPTKNQQECLTHGEAWRVSRPIKVHIAEGDKKVSYDLTQIFLEQLGKHPFASKVDLLDAFSRIYDCEIRLPDDLTQKFGRTYSLPRQKFGEVKKQSPIRRR